MSIAVRAINRLLRYSKNTEKQRAEAPLGTSAGYEGNYSNLTQILFFTLTLWTAQFI